MIAGCATGVDVSSADLAEICQGSDVICGTGAETANAGASGSPSAGASGSSGQSGNSTGGTQSNPSGNGGTGGTNGVSGSAGNSGSSGTNNGSSGTSSGSAGTGAVLQPLAAGTCMASDRVAIIYTDRSNGKDSTNQMTMVLHVNNTGATFDLTTLTIRYWFTDDGATGFTADIDYAALGGGMSLDKSGIKVTFGQELGSNYAEVGFTAAGSVDSNGIDQIQLRLHTGSYASFNQANDFSYQGNANATPNRNITPYISGMQVGGCVPIQ